jgi:hypothetical protein
VDSEDQEWRCALGVGRRACERRQAQCSRTHVSALAILRSRYCSGRGHSAWSLSRPCLLARFPRPPAISNEPSTSRRLEASTARLATSTLFRGIHFGVSRGTHTAPLAAQPPTRSANPQLRGNRSNGRPPPGVALRPHPQVVADWAGVRPWRRMTSAAAARSGGPPAEAARTSPISWK